MTTAATAAMKNEIMLLPSPSNRRHRRQVRTLSRIKPLVICEPHRKRDAVNAASILAADINHDAIRRGRVIAPSIFIVIGASARESVRCAQTIARGFPVRSAPAAARRPMRLLS